MLTKALYFLLAILLFCTQSAVAQDATLFTVGKEAVKVSDFKYIYEKTNVGKADYSESSLREYLNLYAQFKMKVTRARELRLDTVRSLKGEMEGYRRQLSGSYLLDKEVMERLTREAYERSKTDIAISHILQPLPANATAEQDKAAFDKIMKIKAEVTAANFSEKAKQYSEDASTKDQGGRVGFFTVLQLPYSLENAVYSTPVGNISDVVKSPFGYHILKIEESRPARGQVKIAHVLIRAPRNDAALDAEAKVKIDAVYKELVGGAKFEDMVAKYSEDNSSKSKAGVIDWFGINRYEPAFEDAAFSLKSNGAYSQPLRTDAGWHVIQRIEAAPIGSYESSRSLLLNRIKNNERFTDAQDVLVSRIKKEVGFEVVNTIRDEIFKDFGADFTTYTWKPTPNQLADTRALFRVAQNEYSIKDFMNFVERNPAERIGKGGSDPQKAAQYALDKFVKNKVLEYEEGLLEAKYPEFRAILREYEEGILLFESTKLLVWDKASGDEEGLVEYYNKNKENYKWGERAQASIYTIKTTDAAQVEAILKRAKTKSAESVLAKFNTKDTIVLAETVIVERGKNPMVDALTWKKGTAGAPQPRGSNTQFVKIESVLPPAVKSFKEARGYVVADYQDYLEKQWLKELNAMYPLVVDEAVLRSLIQK